MRGDRRGHRSDHRKARAQIAGQPIAGDQQEQHGADTENSSVEAGGNPVSTGTRKVVPNIATTCWAPMPRVRAQLQTFGGCDDEVRVGLRLYVLPCQRDHHAHLSWTRTIPRLSARLAAGRHGRWCHRRRLPRPAGDGVCDRCRPAAGGRPVGGTGPTGRLRGAGPVAAVVGRARVDHRTDDGDGVGPAGRGGPRPLRRAGSRGGTARRRHLLRRRPGADRVSGRPAVPAGTGRLHDRCRGDHDR